MGSSIGRSWAYQDIGVSFGGNCLTCHASIRTTRHQVNFLKPEAIEVAGQENGEVCYGCHGGRSWYRISYPYPRHAWDGMDKDTPDWAKGRPTESEARFRMGVGDVGKGAERVVPDKFRTGAMRKPLIKPAG
jgi:hypothetical protein